MIAISIVDGVVPNVASLQESERDAPIARAFAEKQERSLLYVALTRAHVAAFVTGYGAMSSFLPVDA